jgi:beta-N-acetylhexosaminidase
VRTLAAVTCLVVGAVTAACGVAGEPSVEIDHGDGASVSLGTRPDVATESSTSPVTVEESSPNRPPETAAAECIDRLPLSVRAGQVVWPSVYSSQLDNGDRYALWGVGGVILMDWTSAASAERLREFKSHSEIPLLVATDEEGGRVQRMASLGRVPSAAEVALSLSVEQAAELIRRHARLVRDAGVDIVLGPVVDVSPDSGPGPIGSRSFGSDPNVVTDYARAYVEAWRSVGIIPVLKHFPGHGAATADSHYSRSATAPLDVLMARDLIPYADLADTGTAVMVGHLDTPGLTDGEDVPASLSRVAVTEFLRGTMGYGDALVISDALGMDAVDMSVPDAAVRSLAAGVDVAIFSEIDATPAVIGRIERAVLAGELPVERLNEAVGRVLTAKSIDACQWVHTD